MTNCNVLDCSIYGLTKTLGKKYAVFILIELNKNDCRFSDFEKFFDYLSNVQLSRSLKLLKDEGLINKRDEIYTLSEYGEEVARVILELELVSEKYEQIKMND
jgi:DNA-binding HxlR family transcriptional regulator